MTRDAGRIRAPKCLRSEYVTIAPDDLAAALGRKWLRSCGTGMGRVRRVRRIAWSITTAGHVTSLVRGRSAVCVIHTWVRCVLVRSHRSYLDMGYGRRGRRPQATVVSGMT